MRWLLAVHACNIVLRIICIDAIGYCHMMLGLDQVFVSTTLEVESNDDGAPSARLLTLRCPASLGVDSPGHLMLH